MSSEITKLLTATAIIFTLTACGSPEPLPVSDCGKIVTHVKKVLGKHAPSVSKMKKQCKSASDEARGCAMSAEKPLALSQCDF